jgi:DNA-binding MarR family transcriptional regulator
MGTERETAERVWQAMTVLVTERNDRRREVCDALGMSFVRIKVLRRVATGPMTMRQISELMAIDRPYLTLIVDDLEARGLVSRKTSEHDRRCKIVATTPAGDDAAREAERILYDPPPALLALDPADLAVLDRALGGLLPSPARV